MNHPRAVRTFLLNRRFLVFAAAALISSAPALAQSHATMAKAGKTAARSKGASDASIVKAMGSKDAPITMEVFTDYQCPTCRTFFEQTLRPLMNDYVAAGKVYLVHRDYPLPMHAYSRQAARWANAAAKIGKFEEVEGALYDNQQAWSADGNIQKYVATALSPSEFQRVEKMVAPCAPATGNAPAVAGCSVDDAILKDIALGQQIPVSGTPTYRFTYKGQTYPPGSGFVSWPILRQFFDRLMSQ